MRLRIPEPIKKIALLAACALAVTGCASNEEIEYTIPARVAPVPDEGWSMMKANDPWNGMNRSFYNFNYRVDRWVLLPAVRGYRAITPDPLERGITNFFANIREVNYFINSVFQLSPRKAGNAALRFGMNSTIGLLGFTDPAGAMGFTPMPEDLGQTFGYWGVPAGPYFVMPFLGPSTVRDAPGTIIEFFWYGLFAPKVFRDFWGNPAVTALRVVDTRKNVPFRYYQTGSPFEYEFVRFLYLTYRELEIAR